MTPNERALVGAPGTPWWALDDVANCIPLRRHIRQQTNDLTVNLDSLADGFLRALGMPEASDRQVRRRACGRRTKFGFPDAARERVPRRVRHAGAWLAKGRRPARSVRDPARCEPAPRRVHAPHTKSRQASRPCPFWTIVVFAASWPPISLCGKKISFAMRVHPYLTARRRKSGYAMKAGPSRLRRQPIPINTDLPHLAGSRVSSVPFIGCPRRTFRGHRTSGEHH